MPPPLARYNHLAGRNLGRLAALSDGVFAVAMTLLVLDLRVPAAAAIHGEVGLLHALAALAPRALTYLMSFLTLGIFWNGQAVQLDHLARGERGLTWLHLGFLFMVSMVPFSTSLLAAFLADRTALMIYWVNILALGALLYASWICATRSGLLHESATPAIVRAIRRRIAIAQGLYALGAALAALDTRLAIAAIVLIQLNYVFAPRLAGLDRL